MMSSKLSFFKVWIYKTLLIAGLWSLTACQKDKNSSVIVLAIDRLAFNSFSCSDDKVLSGLNILCKEGIRFTHAYTTSIQPAAALGSLLTGLYPIQHHIHRSYDRLNTKATMIQEHAALLGYRTYFFGGSPSVLKKTGLATGFDIFDDYTFLDKKTYFLDFKIQAEKFLHTALDEKRSFLSIIHNSELASLNEGETAVSSFEILDEKFYNFFQTLKKNNLWDKNYIIVVGLQGESDYSRLSETPFSNLNSENSMVTLFIKPPRNKGDEGIFWKFDAAVNIADLGHSLWKTITYKENPNINLMAANFPVYDLSAVWLQLNKTLTLLPRRLLVEAADTWYKELNLRFSIIYKNLNYIETEKILVFNNLTDGMESINIVSQHKQFVLDNSVILSKIRTDNQLGFWDNNKSTWHDWVISNHEYWSLPNSRIHFFKNELERLNRKGEPQPLSTMLLKHLSSIKKTSDLKNIKIGPMPLRNGVSIDKQKELFYDQAKLHSINLALENIWGLWKPKKEWLYSDLILENQ